MCSCAPDSPSPYLGKIEVALTPAMFSLHVHNNMEYNSAYKITHLAVPASIPCQFLCGDKVRRSILDCFDISHHVGKICYVSAKQVTIIKYNLQWNQSRLCQKCYKNNKIQFPSDRLVLQT